MFSQLFGNYLVSENAVTNETMKVILSEQNSTRAKLGVIAVADGLLKQEQADEINHLQVQLDKRFGDIAVERGYLTEAQVGQLLEKQGSPYMKFLQILSQKTDLNVGQAEHYLKEFQKKEGFSTGEMEALKCDNIDAIVPIFAYSSKPYITDITALILRNITRFVTTDYYIGKIRHVEDYAYSALVGQNLVGDHKICLAFSAPEGEEEGLKSLASGYSQENMTVMNEQTIDAIAEFANVCSGLVAMELAEKRVNVDMEPPFAYREQKVSGTGYLIPIYFEDQCIELFLSVDNEMIPGTTPYEFRLAKNEHASKNQQGKAKVMIVDDSAMMRKVLRSILEEAGYSIVCEAVNGRDAVESFDSYRPSLVTMDITMPEMDGVEALRQIMEINPNAKVVMITAAGQQHKVIESLKLGAVKFIMKPFRKEEVLSGIDEVIC